MAKVDPRLITIDATGTTPTAPHGVRYENITAILAGAIKQIVGELASLEQTVAGFAASFASDRITANKQLCVGDVCVTRDQFLRMVEQSGQAGQGSTASSSASSTDAVFTSPITITDAPPDTATTTASTSASVSPTITATTTPS